MTDTGMQEEQAMPPHQQSQADAVKLTTVGRLRWVRSSSYILLIVDLFDDVALIHLKIEGAAGFVPPKAIRFPGTKRANPLFSLHSSCKDPSYLL